MIDENKILEFIAKNDGRYGSVLDKYKDLIIRLLSEKITLNAIYEFILENDEKIGNKANFYKYCKRLKPKEKKITNKEPTTAIKQEEERKPISTPSPIIKAPTSKNATDILSQDFNLLD